MLFFIAGCGAKNTKQNIVTPKTPKVPLKTQEKQLRVNLKKTIMKIIVNNFYKIYYNDNSLAYYARECCELTPEEFKEKFELLKEDRDWNFTTSKYVNDEVDKIPAKDIRLIISGKTKNIPDSVYTALNNSTKKIGKLLKKIMMEYKKNKEKTIVLAIKNLQ
jgi:hypothetical protein